tara:strand:- start:2222 stop:2431 length:210 start_codon:yes stop_codon:yes gene_type:complete
MGAASGTHGCGEKEENENFLKEDLVPVDIGEDRVGANNHFGGACFKSDEEFTTEMKFGMDDLTFSRFFG